MLHTVVGNILHSLGLVGHYLENADNARTFLNDVMQVSAQLDKYTAQTIEEEEE